MRFSVCPIYSGRHTNYWILETSLNILQDRRQAPPANAFSSHRKTIRRPLKLRLRTDRQLRWNQMAGETEVAFNSGNSPEIVRPISTTGAEGRVIARLARRLVAP